MNDKEYMLAGVELADGWHTLENAVGFLEVVKTYHGFGGPDSDKEIIAALAAQLIEQVDALDDLMVATTKGWAAVENLEGDIFHFAENSDRNMNAIKVIVDSKVLK